MTSLKLTTALFLFLTVPALAADIPFPGSDKSSLKSPNPQEITAPVLQFKGPRPGYVGYYLAGRHAQVAQDWHAANHYLDITAQKDPQNSDLRRRAMVMAMGAGDLKTASDYAAHLLHQAPDDPLSNLFLAAEYLKGHDYKGALDRLNSMKDGGMKDFIMPFVTLWTAAQTEEVTLKPSGATPLHAFHIALIAKITGQEDTALKLLNSYKDTNALKLGDAFYVLGERARARAIYQSLQSDTPSVLISKRIQALSNDLPPPFEVPASIPEGLALSFTDMAKILSAQESIDSARVFAQIALQIDPKMDQAHLLLAGIYKDSNQPGPALAHYKSIGSDSAYIADVQLMIAEIYESYGNSTIALQTLTAYKQENPDIDVITEIGDIHRRNQDYQQAIDFYNKALASFKEKVPPSYWYLYYVRGMAYERLGNWDAAERDFQKALEYQPNDPFVLNYLAYGWAERGINLNKSLEYLEKAVARQPTDGHIRDSLGWALYKLGRYEEAIDPLEKAILFLPYDPTVNEHLGDAYWQVGRKREATFQWQRALNHIEEGEDQYADYTPRLRQKLVSGLPYLAKERVLSAENQLPVE